MLRVPHPRPMNFANPDEWHDWLESRHATTTEAQSKPLGESHFSRV